MQHALRFLEAVLPANGLRVVASKPPTWKNGFKHTFHATNEEVVAEAARLDAKGITNYIALATYADPEAGRTAVNTVEVQSLWVDLDYKQYNSPADAAADIERLAEVVGAPSVKVQSGGGMHAYWVLRQPLPTHQWVQVAAAFQATWQALGIKADPVSADAARVLRLPGTHNRKPEYEEGGRLVVLEALEDVTYPVVSFIKTLKAAPKGKPAKAAPVVPVVGNIPAALFGAGDELSAGVERRPSYVQGVVAKCKQMQYAFANQDKQSEPQWFATIQLVRHLDDGRRMAHAFSCRHPEYSAEATDAKLAQLESKDIGPTTCEQFRRVNPTGCEGCQFNITSPIVLGYKEVENVEPTIVKVEHLTTESGEVVDVERVERPEAKMPDGYKYDGKIVYRVVVDETTGLKRDEPIFAGYLCPERIVSNAKSNYATDIQFYIQSEGQPAKRIVVPGKSLADRKDLSKELNGKGVFFVSKNANHILDVLQKMTQQLQAARRDTTQSEQMGWQEDGSFIVGSTGYRKDGTTVYDLPVPQDIKSVIGGYSTAGSLDEWKRTAEVYNKPGAEAYQFALCYGAAGVFMPLTKLSGVVLSLYSQSPGRGKSTAGFAALSWWGNPSVLKSQSKDTSNSLFKKASRHKNLPILMDEITDKPSWELEELVYFMTQGREKESLTANREARPILPGWALPVISTSNNSIRSKLQAKRGDAQGLFARIVEVNMDLPFAQNMGFTDRMLLRSGFEDNYGVAGPKLVTQFEKNRDVYETLIDNVTVALDKAVDGDSAYRFWIASCACTIAVAHAARQAGLLDYDVGNLIKWAANLLRAQRSDAITNVASSDDVLAQFLEQNANRIIVSYNRSIGAGAVAPAVWPEEFRGSQLVGRAELPERSLYISMPAFMRFCHDAGYDLGAFVRNAAATRDADTGEALLKKASPVTVNLGRGTKTAAARTKALQFNLLHPALREYAVGIDSKIESSHVRSVA